MFQGKMGPRLQFTLRRLLGSVGLLCMCLGAWRLWTHDLSSTIVARDARLGEPIVLDVRVFRASGEFPWFQYIFVRRRADHAPFQHHRDPSFHLERTGRFTYECSITLPPIHAPGAFEVIISSDPGQEVARGTIVIE